MLSRAALGVAGTRCSPSVFRTVNPALRIRSYAKDNKTRPPPRKPTSYSASSKSAASSASGSNSARKSGTGTAAAASSALKGNARNGRADFSPTQEEFKAESSSSQNTAPRSTGTGPGLPKGGRTKPDTGPQPDVSASQAEFKTTANSSKNTAPQSTSPSAPYAAKPKANKQPLPDLTQGIPSTVDQETSDSTSSSRATGTALNLTDDPARAAGGGGRGSGGLPKSAYISSADRRRNRVANFMYAAFLFFSVTGTIYLGRNWESEEEEQKHADAPSGWAMGLFYNRSRARLTDMLDYYNEPAFRKLLPDPDPSFERPFTLVLSLEDLLVHSEWTREQGWRIAKRPGVDYFLRYLQQYYELVIFTTVPSYVAEPVIMKLDPFRIVTWPLFREATRYKDGVHVKDLSYLNRDLSKIILIDTDPSHAKFQPENAIILPKWKGDSQDKELISLIPFLEYVATMGLGDTRSVLKSFDGKHIPTEFAAREAVAREKFQEQLAAERGSRPKRIGKGLMSSLLGIRPGSGIDGLDQSPAEAFEQGKMLQDQIRERGQKQYEALEKEIRENGDKWLKEMAAETKKMTDEQMKGMRSSLANMFIGGGGGNDQKSREG